jgi:hypothetical protein
LIELDDPTHAANNSRQHDAMAKAAGHQTLRFQSKHKPTIAELAALFAKLLSTLHPSNS